LIAFFMKLHWGYAGVIVIHLIVNALATCLFYRFIKDLSGSGAGFITTVLLICCVPFQQYNVSLQTESLFHSFLILYMIVLFRIKLVTSGNFFLLIGLLTILCATRPTGLLIVPPTFLYLSATRWKQRAVIKAIVLSAGGLMSIWVLNRALASGGEFNFMLPFETNMIICGVPNQSTAINTGLNPNSLQGLFYYILNNPAQFLQLAFKKSIAFFGVYRSYFSGLHNILLTGFFSLLYFLSFTGIRKWSRGTYRLPIFCFSAILTVWISVILTCDDWHNRFILILLPCFLILSANPIQSFINRYRLPH